MIRDAFEGSVEFLRSLSAEHVEALVETEPLDLVELVELTPGVDLDQLVERPAAIDLEREIQALLG